MNMKFACILLVAFTCSVNGFEDKENAMDEARGKAKYVLLIHIFYVIATKLFVIKLVYGALFYILLVKSWKFLPWFINFLKETKRKHEYIEFEHDYGQYIHGHDHHGHDHYGHSSHDHHGHDHYGHSSDSYGSYSPYGSYKPSKSYKSSKNYDSDGSYSVPS